MTLFQLVPISEKPSKDGRYWVLKDGVSFPTTEMFENGRFLKYEFEPTVTHYLRPLDPSILEKLLGEAWEAAIAWGNSSKENYEFENTDKQTTIDNLLKQIV